MTLRQARDIVGDNHYQIMKLSTGALGQDGNVVNSSNPLPVTTAQSVLFFTANGALALNETLTPTTGKSVKILSIKLHVTGAPTTVADFQVQIKDAVQARYNTVIVKQAMATVTDFLQNYEGEGVEIVANRTIDFDWANAESDGWGLTVAYKEG